jgi:hypothetical protein
MANLFIWDLSVLIKGKEYALSEIANSVMRSNAVLSHQLSLEESKKCYGLKWTDIFKKLLPDESNEFHGELERLAFLYSNEHPEIIDKYLTSNNNALQLLKLIHCHQDQVLLPDRHIDSTMKLLEKINFRDYFSEKSILPTISVDMDTESLCSLLRPDRFTDIIVIGDSGHDAALAQRLNAVSSLAQKSKAIQYCYVHKGWPEPKDSAGIIIYDLNRIIKHVNHTDKISDQT